MTTVRTVSMSTWTPATDWQSIEYPICIDDAGRGTSKRPRQSNDCTVRALAKAVNLPYDAVYDILAESGRKSGRGFDIKTWATVAHLNGYWFSWKALQAVKGKSRMTIAEFAKANPKGTYILRISKHVMTMIDGVIYDTAESRPDKCVYGYWQPLPKSPAMNTPATQATDTAGGVAVIDVTNILQIIATIASAAKFGETYARIRAAQVDSKRAGVVVEEAPSFNYNCGNYFVRVHEWDRKVRV